MLFGPIWHREFSRSQRGLDLKPARVTVTQHLALSERLDFRRKLLRSGVLLQVCEMPEADLFSSLCTFLIYFQNGQFSVGQ